MLVFEKGMVPLHLDKSGTVRVIGSCVTLDTIVSYFEQGESPEDIVDGFPTLKLADVYAIVSYYLKNKNAVRAYLREREKKAKVTRKKVQSHSNPREMKKRLLTRAQDIYADSIQLNHKSELHMEHEIEEVSNL